MIPVLFKIGNANIYSYGVCIIIALITGVIVFSTQAKNRKLPLHTIPAVITISFFSFYFGSKIFYLIDAAIYGGYVFSFQDIFSGSGYSMPGGLIFLFTLILLYSKTTNTPALKIFDSITLPLVLIYIIARLGCHLAGDGDYGSIIYPDSFWHFLGVSYASGTLPTPPGFVVHPVAVYEIIIYIFFFWFLLRKNKIGEPDGKIFALYLIFTGIERFVIEFLYLNPKLYLGLTQAQVFSLIILVCGIILNNKIKLKSR